MKTINGTRTTGCGRKSTLGTTSIFVAAGTPRSALLAGASLVALLAPAAHDVARAQCVGAPQIISTAVVGPIVGNGGPITVTGAGSVAGGPNGVDATTCSIKTLATQAGGTITGGAGATGPNGGAGGAGVFSANTITTLTNGGAISGGNGGFSSDFLLGGAGGAGVSIVQGATVGWFVNEATGMVSGGAGGAGAQGGAGGTGVANAGTITTLTNKGAINGGIGAVNSYMAGAGAVGVSNAGTIDTLANANGATISGGTSPYSLQGLTSGGVGVLNRGTIKTLTNGGAISGGGGSSAPLGGTGGAGVVNASTATIGSLTNKATGVIRGGGGGLATDYTLGGAGGAGVLNSGTITALTNNGVIQGGPGALGEFEGGPLGPSGAAIFSAGPNASIGSITNSGQIIGDVLIGNQTNLTVYGGVGRNFGAWTGGTINVGYGNFIFASGATALGDNVAVDGGAGTVANHGALMITTPITIIGNFDQSPAGELDFLISGDMAAQYGTLDVTGATTLAGNFGVDVAPGFRLGGGETFDLLTSLGALTGGFDAMSLDGRACSTTTVSDRWLCTG